MVAENPDYTVQAHGDAFFSSFRSLFGYTTDVYLRGKGLRYGRLLVTGWNMNIGPFDCD